MPKGSIFKFVAWFEELSRPWAWAAALFTILGIGLLDFYTGTELSIAPLYLIPVLLVSWCLGRTSGLAVAFLASATLILSNWLGGRTYTSVWILPANIFMRGTVFATLAYVASAFRQHVEQTERLSLIDALTGAWNRRAFYQAITTEIANSRRTGKPFSLAYFDVDDFKVINDTLGHEGGDNVLKTLVSVCMQKARKSDLIGRLGGDEFALLLPETDMNTLQEALPRLLNEVKSALGSNISLSVGALSCTQLPPNVEAVILQADELMYEVKHASKDSIRYADFQAEQFW